MHNRAECPICRTPLRPQDLFDAATEEEEETIRLYQENVGQYGAKVSAAPQLFASHITAVKDRCWRNVHCDGRVHRTSESGDLQYICRNVHSYVMACESMQRDV